MASRNAHSYRAFVHELLRLDEHGDVYDGVLCLGARGGVEYALGSFKQLDGSSNDDDSLMDKDSAAFVDLASRRHYVRVDLHDDSGTPALLDTRQIAHVFDQVTRRALQQEVRTMKQTSSSAAVATVEDDDAAAASLLPPAIRVGDEAFQVVSASFTSVCAIARSRSHGLVVEKLPFGALVVLFRAPHELSHVAPLIGRCCAPLRR